MLIHTLTFSLLACTSGLSIDSGSSPDSGSPPDSGDTADSGSPPDSGDTSDSDPPSDTGAGPTAVATADPLEGAIPFEVTLSGLDSYAGDDPIESYEWTLSDGTVVTGDTVVTTLVGEGTHSFTLKVEDESGLSSEASVDVEASCPGFADATVAGTMAWGEVSGLASGSADGVLWGHSDAQGSGARVYAISTEAVLLGTFTLNGVSDYDFEDIARGPGPEEGVSYLYIADTGDNSEIRSSVKIYRFEEPSDYGGGIITGVETIELTYPDEAHDSESLLIDPLTGDLVLVEKDRAGHGMSGIFWAEAPLSTNSPTELTQVGSLTFGEDPLPGANEATGGDVSPDGTLAVVRTHDDVWVFARDVSQPLHTAFDFPGCGTPVSGEYKGEAVAFARDGSGYYTGGEGSNQPLQWFGLQ